ncbi:DMT family transporter [Salinimonas lutimaris]|uniref:DMT family transporter n=1 Tax=Salinimonas lutimaris TaxID=914153 RepID=UPI0010BFBE0D|nr:multidrug efflux SMR transporter [Salinimonas lutimaris]
MTYLFLVMAIAAETIATLALKASEGFTQPLPSVVVVVGYCAAFYSLSIVLKTLPLGITYAVWAGLGIVFIVALGAIFYKQIPDLPAILGMLLIIAGVVTIQLFSKTAGH